MALKGDFGKLTQLQAKVARVASNDVRERLARVLGAEALAQAQLGFRGSRDPYGDAWASLKLRPGKPLLDTGRMRNSFTYRVQPGGFVVGTNFIGAAVHQHGATITPKRGKFLRFRAGGRKAPWVFAKRVQIPARPMMPSGSRGLGPIWKEAFDDAAKRFLSRIMRP